MNENIDLTNILKNCPKGWWLYSTTLGDVTFQEIDNNVVYPIIVSYKDGTTQNFTTDGKIIKDCDGECTLFPSKKQRDWSKFTAPWYKKERFDPKTLQPFDRVLVRCHDNSDWFCNIFSHIEPYGDFCFCSNDTSYKMCIPYNDNTKRLVGTEEEAPEFYRYWED